MTRDSVLNAEESTSRSAAAAPPCLSGPQMAALGDGLLAITRELQERPEAEASSLSQWLTWLDDEGYDQAGFCAALQHLCQQRLSAEACQQLLAQASARAEAPQGLPEAIEHLSGQHPELLDEILELEQRRQSELERLLATAGGMKKSTKIEIGAGIYVGLGVLTGSVGAGRAYFRQKAFDRMAGEALDRMKQATFTHWTQISQDETIKKCHEIKNSAEKIYRLEYRMPLVKQEAQQISTYSEMCMILIKNAHCNPSLDPLEHSRIASELETRMMACMQPKVYLGKMKEWAIKEGKIDRDIHEFQKIADFDIQLRREFEASDFANEFILKLCKARDARDAEALIKEGVIPRWRDFGTQHFLGKMTERFETKLLQTQKTLLEDLKNNKKNLASELRAGAEEENAFFDLDLSDASVKTLINEMGEAGFRRAARVNINKFFEAETLVFKDSFLKKAIEPYLATKANKIKELEDSTLDAEAQRLRLNEFDRLPENKVYKKLENELRHSGKDVETFLFGKWEIERDKAIQSINRAVEEKAKKEAENQLAALDDFQDWVDSELKKDTDLLIDFIAADVGKDIREAYAAVRAAEGDIPK